MGNNLAFKTSDVFDLSGVLVDKAAALSTAIASGSTATTVDGNSTHTWYGIPEATSQDINQAIDLVNLVMKKVRSATITG